MGAAAPPCNDRVPFRLRHKEHEPHAPTCVCAGKYPSVPDDMLPLLPAVLAHTQPRELCAQHVTTAAPDSAMTSTPTTPSGFGESVY